MKKEEIEKILGSGGVDLECIEPMTREQSKEAMQKLYRVAMDKLGELIETGDIRAIQFVLEKRGLLE